MIIILKELQNIYEFYTVFLCMFILERTVTTLAEATVRYVLRGKERRFVETRTWSRRDMRVLGNAVERKS